jgi:hypothetical protein
MNYNFIAFISTVIVIYIIYKEIYKYNYKEKKSIFFSIILGFGLFFGLYITFGEFILLEPEYTNQKIFPPAFITVVLSVYYYFSKADNTTYFKSTEEKNLYNLNSPIYKKVSEISSDKIGTYPRITIYEMIQEEEKIIFDSSDFNIINKTFGTWEGTQQSFREDYKFEFKGSSYRTKDVRLDFMCIFDDYSSSFIKHTDVYEGSDTPYNLQIIVKAIKL